MDNRANLKIEYVPVSKLKPYERNARKHSAADIEAIADSIRRYGMNDPVGVYGNALEIVEGHGRVLAAKKLGLKEVPVVRLDHMTDEERRAYAIQHNRTAELLEWDFGALKLELPELPSLDLCGLEFDLELRERKAERKRALKESEAYYGDRREETYRAVNLNDYDETRVDGFYQMPVIEPCLYIPEKLVDFGHAKSSVDFDCGVHFFIDDYQFERVWANPHKMMERLKPFSCCFTPDFSLYTDMPMAMKVWNVYRSRLIGQIMQDAGINVIPTLSWAESDTFSFCFDGLKQGGVVAVSTIGVVRSPEARRLWTDGMDYALKRLNPKAVLCYGNPIDYDFGETQVKYYKPFGNEWYEKAKRGGRDGRSW